MPCSETIYGWYPSATDVYLNPQLKNEVPCEQIAPRVFITNLAAAVNFQTGPALYGPRRNRFAKSSALAQHTRTNKANSKRISFNLPTHDADVQSEKSDTTLPEPGPCDSQDEKFASEQVGKLKPRAMSATTDRRLVATSRLVLSKKMRPKTADTVHPKKFVRSPRPAFNRSKTTSGQNEQGDNEFVGANDNNHNNNTDVGRRPMSAFASSNVTEHQHRFGDTNDNRQKRPATSVGVIRRMDNEYSNGVDKFGWRYEVSGDPCRLKRLPARTPYTFKLDMSGRPKPHQPQVHNHKPLTMFSNTIPERPLSFVVHPNFVSEKAAVLQSRANERKYNAENGTFPKRYATFSFVY